jgi:protein-arginine kinase activator protein McsA
MPLKISYRSTSHHLDNSSLRRSHLCHGTIDPEALTDRNTPISELQKLLQTAIDSEDYAVAAQLRDEIEYVEIFLLEFFFTFYTLNPYVT